MRTRLLWLSIAAFLVLPTVLASELDEPESESPIALHEATAGSLLFRTDHPGAFLPAPTLHTDVKLQISGLIARARVCQRFHNPLDFWVEGVYVFPLPETAAVDRMRMRIGERVIEGKIQEREQAKKTYEKAKSEGRKASLLEQERPNIFTTSVANIGPDETIEIEIEYQQDLHYEKGRFGLRFPMVVGPRYIPGAVEIPGFDGTGWGINTTEVPDASRITPPVQLDQDDPSNPVDISIALNAGLPLTNINSPSHSLRTVKREGNWIHLEPSAGTVPASKDFVLEWFVEPSDAPRAALFTQEMGQDHYVLLMVMPPEGQSDQTSPLPRETIFIIDTSGSMGGASIRQARKALVFALHRLREEDAFNVIQFNNSASRLFPQSVSADLTNVEKAVSYVKALEAQGGTEMLSALRLALPTEVSSECVRQVIFITDGSVGNEAALFEYIRSHLGRSRLFTVGIGSAPNSYFMRKAAQFGRGTFTHIGDLGGVNDEMTRLFRKLESPVLSDIRVDWSHPGVESWPENIPDLYLGEPVVVAARLSGSFGRLGTVSVSGQRLPAPWQTTLTLQGGAKEAGIDKLWARKKIASLMDRLSEGVSAQVIKESVVEVGLRHHLVSPYTSLVAVDVTPTAPVGELPQTRPIPVNLPDGWSAQHVLGPLPRGATPAPLYLLLGLFTSGAAWILRKVKRRAR